MSDELNSLIFNDTWELGPDRPSRNLPASKWVHKIKYKYDGTVECYKSRLVAANNHQQAGIDFHETLSPDIRPAII